MGVLPPAARPWPHLGKGVGGRHQLKAHSHGLARRHWLRRDFPEVMEGRSCGEAPRPESHLAEP